MATHSSILAWIIPWTEEPVGLHSPWGCKESDITEVTEHASEKDNPEQHSSRWKRLRTWNMFPDL